MSEGLTLEEQATNYYTMQHIARVRELLDGIIIELLRRGREHDKSKLSTPEVEAFTRKNHLIKQCGFESEEYKQNKEDMAEALEHHYANNSHHPEHFKDGVNDMNLLDLIEMFCDWKAASERQNAGNIRKSIDVCCDKFGVSEQLRKIFINSLHLVGE